MNSLKKIRDELKFVISNTGEIDILHAKDTEVWEGERRLDWINNLREESKNAGISPELISFALGLDQGQHFKVISTGANRNFLLLNLVGKKFISVDDDVVFEAYKLNNQHFENCIPASESNPLKTIFFNSKEKLNTFKNNMAPVDLKEFFQTHRLMLDYVNEGRRCGMSLSGYFGDSGFQSPRSVFSFDESSIEHLVRNEETLNAALNSRMLWRVSDTKKMMETSPVMPICAGFANDLDLPPFFPLGRNQDGAYGYAMSGCLNSVFIGHMDIAIRHDPLDVRSYSKDFSPLQIRINDLIALIWVELLKQKKEKSYSVASLHFKEFSSAENFSERLRSIISEHFTHRASAIEKKITSLRSKNKKEYERWIELAGEEQMLCIDSSKNLSYMIPIEAQDSTDNQLQAIELSRKWLRLYAELLEAWPAIRRIAGDLDPKKINRAIELRGSGDFVF